MIFSRKDSSIAGGIGDCGRRFSDWKRAGSRGIWGRRMCRILEEVSQEKAQVGTGFMVHNVKIRIENKSRVNLTFFDGPLSLPIEMVYKYLRY